MKNIFFLGALSAILCSCASEKYQSSPLTFNLNRESAETDNSRISGNTVAKNVYASEITNLISSFPKFRNDAVNKEIIQLKISLQDYLYAIESYNLNAKSKAFRNFEKSYKNIQALRRYLSPDENMVVNRYLVRLKTNLSALESVEAPTPVKELN